MPSNGEPPTPKRLARPLRSILAVVTVEAQFRRRFRDEI